MFTDKWEWRKILITVKAYPTPARRGIEVSCTAGITEDGQWIRIFPVSFRLLSDDQQFKKYQWIEARVKKASDPRIESHEIDADSIRILGKPIPSSNNWDARKNKVFPLKNVSLCNLQEMRRKHGAPTLGFFRPRRITSLEIVPEENPEWTDRELASLRQSSFFDDSSRESLEKIPYKFYYSFECEDTNCKTHRISCYDWEMSQAYRNWHRKYGEAGWESKFRQKFEHEMLEQNDTHFYVGTTKAHPNAWIIVGLFYPRKFTVSQQSLFPSIAVPT